MVNRCLTPRTAFVALAGIILMAGCGGLNQQPLAPDRAATLQKANGSAYSSDTPFTLVLAPKGFDPSKARVRATKPILVGTAKGLFTPGQSRYLTVESDHEDGDGRGVRVESATFRVSKGAIDRAVTISMAVYSGSLLDDIGVVFGPSGLRFNPPATLTLLLRGKLGVEDLNALKAYHIEGSNVTELSTTVSRDEDHLQVTIQVPGFSMFSLDDSFAPEAGGGW